MVFTDIIIMYWFSVWFTVRACPVCHTAEVLYGLLFWQFVLSHSTVKYDRMVQEMR